MGLLRLMILCFGAFGLAIASECVPETAKCSQLWQKIEPHKGLMETEEHLNEWCRKQPQFYECLEDVLLAGKHRLLARIVLDLPIHLLISQLFAEDLCTEGSTNRGKYLSNAACINQLNTEFCTQSEYLDIVLPDDAIAPSTCSLAEKTFSCIAATVVSNCGFDAGKVYRNLLKITRYSDEVCGIELSHGIPQCEEAANNKASSGNEKHSEKYYGSVHRIGSILEQEVENPEPSSVASNEAVISQEVENPEPSVASNEAAISKENYETGTETIKRALDSLDGNPSVEDTAAESGEETSVSEDAEISELLSQRSQYLKRPIIAQISRNLLLYNYSDEEYSFYWRQPLFTIMENLYCEHLKPNPVGATIFHCIFGSRYRDRHCEESGESDEPVHEPLTPELIRDIDPDVPDDSTTEIGPLPYWMKPVDGDIEGMQSQDRQYTCDSPLDSDDLPIVCSAAFIFLSVANTIKESPEWKRLDEEDNASHIFPDDLLQELMSIFMLDPEEYIFPLHIFQTGYELHIFIYESETKDVKNLTCSRVNECNPRSRGLWKCHAFRRKVETPHGSEADIEGSSASYSFPSNRNAKLALKVSETTDATLIPVLDSEVSEAPLRKLITLVFNNDGDSEKSRFNPFYERLNPPADDAYLFWKDWFDSEDFDPKDSYAEDSSVRLVVLEQDSGEHLETSSRASELKYAVNGMKIFDDEQVSGLNLSDANYALLNENVILLRDVSDTRNVEPEYAIVNTPDDAYN